jgi:hypothetical protein
MKNIIKRTSYKALNDICFVLIVESLKDHS